MNNNVNNNMNNNISRNMWNTHVQEEMARVGIHYNNIINYACSIFNSINLDDDQNTLNAQEYKLANNKLSSIIENVKNDIASGKLNSDGSPKRTMSESIRDFVYDTGEKVSEGINWVYRAVKFW